MKFSTASIIWMPERQSKSHENISAWQWTQAHVLVASTNSSSHLGTSSVVFHTLGTPPPRTGWWLQMAHSSLSCYTSACSWLTERGASLPSFCWLRRITSWLRFAETSWGHLVQFPLLKKDHLELDAQDHDEMVFEYPQVWIMPVWEIWTMLHHYLYSSPRAIWGRQAMLCCPKMYRLSLKRSPVKIPAAVLNTGTLAYARSEAFKSHKYTLFLLSSKKTLNQLGKTAN